MTEALKSKDFAALVDITIQDSESLHAVMADTNPPIIYRNDTSHNICALVRELNETAGEPVAAYTIDAGANVFLIVDQHRDQLFASLQRKLHLDSSQLNPRALSI